MNCPLCSTPLTLGKDKGTAGAFCPTCKGSWFEDEELRQAKDHAEPDANWIDFDIWKHEDRFHPSTRNLPCPSCSQALVTVTYEGTDVEVDVCPTCHGIWLDEGEFAGLVNGLSTQITTMGVGDYVSASLREALEVVHGPESLASEWKDLTTVLRLLQDRILVGSPNLAKRLVEFQQANPFK